MTLKMTLRMTLDDLKRLSACVSVFPHLGRHLKVPQLLARPTSDQKAFNITDIQTAFQKAFFTRQLVIRNIFGLPIKTFKLH